VYVGLPLALSAAATVGGLLRLRRREGAAAVPVPGHPWPKGLFLAASLASALFLVARQPLQAGAGVATLAVGAALHPLFARRRRQDAGSRDASARSLCAPP